MGYRGGSLSPPSRFTFCQGWVCRTQWSRQWWLWPEGQNAQPSFSPKGHFSIYTKWKANIAAWSYARLLNKIFTEDVLLQPSLWLWVWKCVTLSLLESPSAHRLSTYVVLLHEANQLCCAIRQNEDKTVLSKSRTRLPCTFSEENSALTRNNWPYYWFVLLSLIVVELQRGLPREREG